MTASDPVDAIAAALAQLRGRRGPRPPWLNGGNGGAGGAEGPGPWHHPGHGHHGGRRGFGPPWAMQMQGGRLAGPARLRLLEALVSASGPLSVGEIADAVGVDQPRASRLVQQGVELGLVERRADADDARRTRVALTAQGEAIVRGFRGDRRDLVREALSGFTPDERAELARLLGKLATGWPAS